MATGDKTSRPGPVVIDPKITAEVNLPPTVLDYDLDRLFPNIDNSALPDPDALNSVAASQTRLMRTAKVGSPLPYAFGITPVRPTLIGADDTGESLVLDFMWSIGEIEQLNGIPESGMNYVLYLPDQGFKDVSDPNLYEHFTGTSGQAASTIMTALKGSYSSYPGIAHSVITVGLDWDLNIIGFVKGVKHVDPRTSDPNVLVYTANPALILADMLTLCGYVMDWDSVADAADYCDEQVGNSPDPISDRWTCSGVIYERTDLQAMIHTMAQYAHCFVDKSGSTFFLRPDKARASNHVATANDMMERSVRLKLRGLANTVDGVRVNFDNVETTMDAEYGVLTNPGTIAQLRMPYWKSPAPYAGNHAKRHAEEVWRKSQLGIESLEFISFDEGLNRTVGDVGTITNAAVGLTAKEMVLLDNKQIGPGRWQRKYTEYSDDVYQDATYDTEYPSNEIYNPHFPPPGPTPALDWIYNEADPIQPILTLSWTGLSWAYIRDYFVRVYSSDDPPVIVYDTNVSGFVAHAAGTITLDLSAIPVLMGTTFTADVYVRSNVNAVGTVPGTASVTLAWRADSTVPTADAITASADGKNLPV